MDHEHTTSTKPMSVVQIRDQLNYLRDKFWIIRLAVESDAVDRQTAGGITALMDEFSDEVTEMERSLGVLFPPRNGDAGRIDHDE